MTTEREKIIDKIKKCLALSRSSNEHEAAAALRQAQKLMELYAVSDLDVLASQAEERQAKAGVDRHPTNWETNLACEIADDFACDLLFIGGAGRWAFIGCGPYPEIAQYAFFVLLRQIKRARRDYIQTQLNRCKLANKTRRADTFCMGWVLAATCLLQALARTEEQDAAVKAYKDKNHPAIRNLYGRDRNADRRMSDRDYDDLAAGKLSGRNAQLHRGVGEADKPLALSQ